jgi:hypothetical protein
VLISLVKGISRRVIVVRNPDPRFFEQAIFLLREDALSQDGVTADQVVAEARQVATGYIRRNSPVGKRISRLTPLAYAAFGAALTGLIWCLSVFL